VIESRSSDSAQQNCGRRKASLNRVTGKGIIRRGQRGSADGFVLKANLMPEGIGNRLEDQDCLPGNFRADSVSGEDG
jgi:hypothetical protein